MKTVLDDGDAATARSTFGANNASNFTTGTVADARLPGTMSSKIFSGPVYLYSSSGTSALEIGKPDVINSPFIDFHSAGTVNDFDVRLIASGGAVGNGLGTLSLTAATFAANGALSAASGSFAGQVGAGSLKSTAEYIDNNSDRVLQFRTIAGTTRGMVRHDQANDAVIISTFNSAGSWYRDLYIGGSSSEIQWGGNIRLGSSALFQNDGNIYMPMYGNYLSNVLDSKITADGRSYPRRVGGAPINFHWSGQGGQPSWLWGGNDGQEMYVYNPSNFNVNYANSAGSAATLSNWSGWAGTWIGASRIGGTVYQNTTGRWLPISASGGNNGIAILYGPTAATATSAHYAGYSGGNDFSTFGLVPPGWYYSFSATLNVFEARN